MTHSYTLTLIANPAIRPLDESITTRVREALEATGSSTGDISWLEPNTACDIPCATAAQEAIEQELGDLPIDFILQPTASRQKKMLISDMDSTMIQQECIDELADFVGVKAKVAEITERAMNGDLDFKAALVERVHLLKGLPEATLLTAYKERITFTPGAKTLVATMRKAGAHCMLVSGGFTFFTHRVAEDLGFHFHESNVLEVKDGKLTGIVLDPIKDKHAKLASLESHSAEKGFGPENILAIGDGANDLPMLKAAGLGVAYYAKPSVQKEASARINHTDLTALLYAQGYRRTAWV
jgi:phosphoserine phosphatase